MRTCSGHMNKNVGLSIEDKVKKKTMNGVSVSEKQMYVFLPFPSCPFTHEHDSSDNINTCIQFPCYCRGKPHKFDKPPYCGYFNVQSGFVKYVKGNNMKLMIEAGKRKDPDWYRSAVKALFTCLTDDDHTNCQHHERGNSIHLHSHIHNTEHLYTLIMHTLR